MVRENLCLAKCGRTSMARGLCNPCYQKARILIRGDSEWSWERLESMGFALKKVIQVKKPKKKKERGPYDDFSPVLRRTIKRLEEQKERENKE